MNMNLGVSVDYQPLSRRLCQVLNSTAHFERPVFGADGVELVDSEPLPVSRYQVHAYTLWVGALCLSTLLCYCRQRYHSLSGICLAKAEQRHTFEGRALVCLLYTSPSPRD